MWDVATGVELARLRGHGKSIYSVAWSPDGSKVAIGSQDATASIWDVEVTGRKAENLRDEVCERWLIGSQAFTDAEMQAVILSGRDYLRNPCTVRGPISIDYWRRQATEWRDTLSHWFHQAKSSQGWWRRPPG